MLCGKNIITGVETKNCDTPSRRYKGYRHLYLVRSKRNARVVSGTPSTEYERRLLSLNFSC